MILLTMFCALALSPQDAGRGAPTEAQVANSPAEKGHWMWVSDPTFGPRGGPPTTRRRVWVKDVVPAAASRVSADTHPKVWRYVTETKVGPRSGAPTLRKVLLDQ